MAKIFIYDFWNVTILELSKLRHLSDLWMDGWMQVFHQGLFFKCTFCKGEMLFLAWCAAFNPLCHLTLSWRRPLYRNQSIDLWSKSVDWFLYDNSLRHERVNPILRISAALVLSVISQQLMLLVWKLVTFSTTFICAIFLIKNVKNLGPTTDLPSFSVMKIIYYSG